MTASAPSRDRSALAAVGLPALIAALTAGFGAAVTAMAAPSGFRTPLAWGGGAAALALSVAVAVAARGLHSARWALRRLEAARRRAERARRDMALREEDFARHQATTADRFERERAALFAEFGEERGRLITEFAEEHGRLVAEFTEDRTHLLGELAATTAAHSAELAVQFDRFAAEQERFATERARLTDELGRLGEENARLSEDARQARANRDATVAAIAGVAGRLQALTTAMLADLRAMEDRYTDDEIFADLLRLDHSTAQGGRLADSVAVLTGARSGRRWARPIGMESVLRGAMGRISGYQRVRVHATGETSVAGHAAEGVMHVVAELLDNAANFSPPTAEVHVYVEEVSSGIVISVEDAGLVMSDAQHRRAEQAVSGEVDELGGISGTRLGLVVVGRLARKHGLTVSFRPSSRGGTSALVMVPREILSHGPTGMSKGATKAAAASPPATPPRAAVAVSSLPSAQGLMSPDTATVSDTPASGGLPRRRRGQSLAAAERSRARTIAERDDRLPAPPVRALRFGSFRQGVRGTPAPLEGPEAIEAPPDGPDAHPTGPYS
ncbi:sensor histidine kinase [Streptomyces sp. NPDC014656]|uniref:sensor histidine kinase n=1 Tax=Streptomyces sp. NPDC014656 TaxID=3364878 RepID=UPI0036F85096